MFDTERQKFNLFVFKALKEGGKQCQRLPAKRRCSGSSELKAVFHLSCLVGRKELVLASLHGKVQSAREHFSRHNFPNSRALADPGAGDMSGTYP